MIETNLKNFISGDTVDFYIKSRNYNTKDYDCIAIFKNNETIRIETNNKDDERFNFFISEEESEKLKSGTYQLFCLFFKDNFKKTERSIVFNIDKNIEDENNNIDVISYNKKMLKALNDLIEGRLQDDYESYTIGNRSITKMNPADLLKLRDYFQERVNFEEEKEKNNGFNKGNKIIIKFLS